MSSTPNYLTGNGNLKYVFGDFGGALVAVIGVFTHITALTWAGFAIGIVSALILAFRIRTQLRADVSSPRDRSN